MLPLKFATKIYRHDLMLQEARDDQQKLKILINKLNNNYNPTNITKIKEKNDTLKSAKKLFFIREDIINAFKKGNFCYIDGFQEEKTKADANAFNEQIIKEETDINTELFKKHFNFQRPSDMLKSLYKVNTNQNNELVNVINSGLRDSIRN